MTGATLADAVERAMDAAGFARAHIAGNSLGGYVALQLAARGRAESVVALAPAGGWEPGRALGPRRCWTRSRRRSEALRSRLRPRGDLVATPEGRRRATAATTVAYAHIPAEPARPPDPRRRRRAPGSGRCSTSPGGTGTRSTPPGVTCPVRIVWGTEDALLPWPDAAARMRRDWLPHADWVELDGVGHCPQLDVPARGRRADPGAHRADARVRFRHPLSGGP